MSTIKLKDREEICDAMEEGKEVACEPWRWGTNRTYVFERDGKHFEFTAQFHSEDGLQDDDVDAYEVRPVEKTITVYERV